MWRMCVMLWMVPCLAAAATPPTQPSGAANPKEAARNLAIAFSQPTREGLRGAVAGKTPAEEKAADLWAESLAAQFRLQEAIKSKFGDGGYATFFGRRPATRPAQDQLTKQIDDAFAAAKIEEAGDEARVTLSVGAQAQQIWLMKLPDGTWRAWIGAVLQARSPRLIDSYIKYNQDFGPVRDTIADAVEVGTFKDAQQAHSAMSRLEDQAEMKSDPASSRPTATPQQAQEQIRAQMQEMRDLEAERDRLEREAATRPVGQK